IDLQSGVASGTGNITVLAQVNVSQSTAASDITTVGSAAGSGTVDVEALSGTITMHNEADTSSGSGNIRYSAATTMTIGSLTTLSNVSLSGTSITDSGTTETDITAATLMVRATTGFGEGSNHIETTIDALAAAVGAGGLFVTESNGVTVDTVAAIAVNRIGLDGAILSTPTGAVLYDLTTTGGGSVVLVATLGNITLNDGDSNNIAISANGSGNILVQAVGATGNITANADIDSTSGNVSVLAGQSITFTANADIRTTVGTIDLEAGVGSNNVNATITMDAASLFTTSGDNGDIRLLADNNVVVGDIVVTTGDVAVTATAGSISDADALVDSANDSDIDVTAIGLRLWAGVGIGATVNHLETTITTLSARATSGGIYLLESDTLAVGDVSDTTNRVASDATTATTSSSDATQSDVRTASGNGNIVIRTTNGNIDLNGGTVLVGLETLVNNTTISADGSGNILIQALGTNADITANADITSVSGNISIMAGQSITFATNADIRTTVGTIDLEAGVGSANGNASITMSATSLFTTSDVNGDVRLLADNNVVVGDIVVTTGDVAVTATAGSISDADALVGSANDSDIDVTAIGLRLWAGVGIGATVNHLETAITTLSAHATSGGIYILESTGLTVDDVSVTTNRVASDATTGTTSSSDATQSDVRTTSGNGNIVIRATNGSIILNDGTVLANLGAGTDNTAVSADGSGHILIQAIAAATDITANADINSGSGNISVLAGRSITFNTDADIRTSTNGTIDVLAGTGGSITMSAT
ncbi:MAG: beta strand repeat-containing protein, partial [Desulfuromonadaceae bacterium]